MHVELIVLSAVSREKYKLLPGESVVLGRDAVIRLHNDKQVSRVHANIAFREGRVYVTDLGSRNGTLLAGVRLPPHQPFEVEDGEEVEISQYRVACRVIAAEDIDPNKTQLISLLPPAEFDLIEEIGRGGMGSVWKARHKLLGIYRAIKLLHENLMSNPEERKRFLREVKIAAGITCPNIVTVHDARLLHGRVYLIMEYIGGPSLQRLRHRGPVTNAEIISVSRGVAVALQELLTHGIMHRDVKPGNILVDASGVARLTDFGIARPFISNATIDRPRGEGLGSLAFIAPEQAQDAEKVDQRADIFGLGATIYYLISGLPPRNIKDRTIEDILDLLEDDPLPLHQVARGFPPKLGDLVMRMMARKPEDRPHGPGEVIPVLDELIKEEQRVGSRALSDRTLP